MNKRIITTVVLFGSLVGCEKKVDTPPKTSPATVVKVRTPARTEYTGEGKVVYRKVDAIRIFSPFGVSPGEVITAQKPMSITEGPAPGVNIAPAAVETTANGGGTWSSGGFKRTWWDRIVSFFRKMTWFLIIGGVAAVGLYLWPVTRPIIASLGRIVAAVIPVVGSAIEWLVGRFRVKTERKYFNETVSGVQAAKDAIDDWVDQCAYISTEQKATAKADLRKLVNTTMATKQDASTQSEVITSKKK